MASTFLLFIQTLQLAFKVGYRNPYYIRTSTPLMLQRNQFLVSVISNILTHENALVQHVCYVSRIKATKSPAICLPYFTHGCISLSALYLIDLCVNFVLLVTSLLRNIKSHFISEIIVDHPNESNYFRRLQGFLSVTSGAFQPSRNKYHEIKH